MNECETDQTSSGEVRASLAPFSSFRSPGLQVKTCGWKMLEPAWMEREEFEFPLGELKPKPKAALPREEDSFLHGLLPHVHPAFLLQ